MNEPLNDKCKDCPALKYPYLSTFDFHNHKRPKEEWVRTCAKHHYGCGAYGDCMPDICEGPYGRSYRTKYITDFETGIPKIIKKVTFEDKK